MEDILVNLGSEIKKENISLTPLREKALKLQYLIEERNRLQSTK